MRENENTVQEICHRLLQAGTVPFPETIKEYHWLYLTLTADCIVSAVAYSVLYLSGNVPEPERMLQGWAAAGAILVCTALGIVAYELWIRRKLRRLLYELEAYRDEKQLVRIISRRLDGRMAERLTLKKEDYFKLIEIVLMDDEKMDETE